MYFYPESDQINATNTPIAFVNVDNISLYEIPSVPVSQTISCGQSITIGPACPISDPDVSYSWLPTGGSTANLTVSPNTTSTYTLTTTVNSSDGPCTVHQVYTVDVTGAISVNITSTNSVLNCNFPNVTLNATPGYSSYQWTGPITGNSSSLTINAPGTYTVTATQGSCSATQSIIISSDFTTPAIAISQTSSVICSGQSGGVTLSSICPTCNSYLWMPGGFTTSQISVNPTTTSTYTVTGSSANGCTASQTTTIEVIPNNISAPILIGPSSSCQKTPADPLTYTISNWDPALAAYYTISILYTDGTTNSIPASQSFQLYFANGVGGMITVSVGIEGTECFNTSTFYVQECCSNGSSLIRIYDGEDVETALTAQGHGGNSQANIQIFLSGTVVMNPNISGSYTFDNCILNFDPGSKLIIQGGSTVYFLNSHLQPSPECCMMWKGVEVTSNSKIYFKAGSICEQAE